MDKKYMLIAICNRIAELEKQYRKYFDQETGPSKTYYGAACMRSRIKKELETLKLIQYLLMYCPDTMEIDSAELTAVFDRLVEPRRHK